MYTIKNKHNKNVRKEEGIMYKYLYIYNYEPREQALCEMEFKRIFHIDMTSKYFLTNQYFDYRRSVYIRGRLDIIASSCDINEVIQIIEEQHLYYLDFKVIYLKNEITHVHYQTAMEYCKKLAFPIDGSVNMQKPQTVFALTKLQEQWYFGIYHDESVWNLRSHKPHSYSHSLNIRDARTAVNIAIANDLSLKVVDPCCGVGTVVLEALSMGIDIEGYDINRYVSYQARLNLEYFGYDPLKIQKKDMLKIEKTYDVAIMDIPYGVYSPFTYQQQQELLQKSYFLAHQLVLISHIDMNKELERIGYEIIDQASIMKGNFKRYVTFCRKVI